MFRQALAVSMSLLLTVPLWAISAPVGTIASSDGATVSGTLAAPGSSLYSGDTLTVPAKGNASLLLNGGSRVLIGSNSLARVVRHGSAFALEVKRGGVAFTSSSHSLVEGRVADIIFHPKNPSQPAVGYIKFLDPSHPVFYADRGTWLLTSSDTGNSRVLNSGEKIEGLVTTANSNQNNQSTTMKNKKNHKKKMAVIWIGTALVGTATGLGLAFGKSECTSPTQNPNAGCGNSVSPVSPSGTPQL